MKKEIVEERKSKLFIINISSPFDGNIINILAKHR